MSARIDAPREIDAAAPASRSAAGTRFDQARLEVGKIQNLRPLSLKHDTPPGLVQGVWNDVKKRKAELTALQNKMQATGDIRFAPRIAIQAAEVDYRATLAAKVLAKAGTTIKEIATAA
ncbi:hypothetical protein [Mitsuaria sp. GD03876]|uniref:hypothetical protein n=1 Tax=Mitsuaria sp. GD03876 TaxID=2975399 RepID=UPI002447EEF9|nr:hypothetical protein [Mitsuaria sp. GD03876]MDH0865325.1 hypothetical protein [Mitsuaria sp. GD03876]